jgi:NitT/TauT family transport system permease protein
MILRTFVNFTLVMVSLAIIAVVATLMYQGVAVLERMLTRQFQ